MAHNANAQCVSVSTRQICPIYTLTDIDTALLIPLLGSRPQQYYTPLSYYPSSYLRTLQTNYGLVSRVNSEMRSLILKQAIKFISHKDHKPKYVLVWAEHPELVVQIWEMFDNMQVILICQCHDNTLLIVFFSPGRAGQFIQTILTIHYSHFVLKLILATLHRIPVCCPDMVCKNLFYMSVFCGHYSLKALFLLLLAVLSAVPNSLKNLFGTFNQDTCPCEFD